MATATIRRRAARLRRRPDRSPGSSSSTARRSSPDRTARCSWATSARTSSRSSRPRATRRAAGVRRGSGRAAGPDDPDGAAYYLAVNRNKRCAPARPQDRAGAEVLRRLLARGDVLVENFRVGGFARLGFDDEVARGAQPRARPPGDLAATARPGPAADRPGYDFVIQAVSGLMSITGAPDDGGRRADQGRRRDQRRRDRDARRGRRPGGARRARADAGSGRRPGGGQRIDVSLLGATLASLVNQAQNAFVTGVAPGRLGNAHPNIVPYETFATADGEIARGGRLGAPVGRASATRSGCPGWRPIRASRRTATGSTGAPSCGRSWPRASRSATTAAWLARRSTAAEIPCGPINDVLAAFASPEAGALGMIVEQSSTRRWGPIRQVGIPFKLGATPASIRTAAADARRGHRRDPGRARLRRRRDVARAPRRGVV